MSGRAMAAITAAITIPITAAAIIRIRTAITAALLLSAPAITGRAIIGRRGYYGCDNGTTGAIVGGAAGALVGREIGRDGRGYRYRYGRRGGGTTGAIIGGALGALIGSEASRC